MKNHLVLEKSWFIAIGTISEQGDDSICIQIRSNQNGRWNTNLCHKMEIFSFAVWCYASGFICDICYENYSTLLKIGRWCCEVSYSTKYGVRDQHGKEK